MSVGWIILIIAGFFEIVWAVGLKHTEGFTKLWPSVIDASKELNISRSSISNNCRGLSKTSNGFIWSYIELNL